MSAYLFGSVFIAVLLGLFLLPIYMGRAAAMKSWRIFVPRKGSYWIHKEKGFVVKVSTTACEVWYGYVIPHHLGDDYLDPGCHRNMSVDKFYKTFRKLSKKQLHNELEAEKGLRALATL